MSHRNNQQNRRGLTLIELIIAMTVTAGLLTVLSGVMIAVESARDHTEGVSDTLHHAEMIHDRIGRAINRCGVYQIGAGSITCGIATLQTTTGAVTVPDTLVVWAGEEATPLADEGVIDRLPLRSELRIFAPHDSDSRRLDEITFPSATGTIDFTSGTFASEIETLLASSSAVRTKLTDRIRGAVIPSSMLGAGQSVSSVRFVITEQPTDGEIASASDEASWIALPWAGGVRTLESGLRAVTVETELQFDILPVRNTDESDGAYPSFRRTSRHYLHEGN
ncbi:prepilin-type N-terminal cleavage/methylation domain-containing protein [Calycomorphotria hydatis]|uniref:Pseudopilin GspJ n=1 Tax=Calycomorphotria hydatis TaxID=2528027 RepID=A0A517TF22_9PLAN|nr:prepilin-type N-terminal cleavage/methylation domain-containing protein [Calycomorphotria hydatis]QDT66976.1 hypothetical protein V22_42480 [Calycomorphotria hydatis]